MDDKTLKPEADWHPKIKDIVYHGMDWLCPSYNQVLANQLTTLYGNITVENAVKYVTPIVQTGSLIATYYDLTNEIVYTANARGANETGPADAYDRYVDNFLNGCSLIVCYFLLEHFYEST
jgi:isopenicillin-N N-acyltransferase-like protein